MYTHHNRHTYIHTTHIHTHTQTHALQTVLIYRPRSWDKNNLTLWTVIYGPFGERFFLKQVLTFMSNLVCLQQHPEIFCFHGGTRGPMPGHPLGRRRPSRDGNRQPRPLGVEALTVPGSYHGTRGRQQNVAEVVTASLCVKI